MDFFQVRSNYYSKGPLLRAGEKAEVLWFRAKAYCADQENDGFIPREVLPLLTPSQPTQRARALVEVEEWTPVEGGWQFTHWDQITRAELEEKRAAANQRQRNHRARRKSPGVSRVTADVTHNAVTEQEVEEEVIAAASGSSNARELPPPLVILRTALEARKLFVRWDTLTDDQITDIEHLIDLHGDSALVSAAVRMYRPDRPAAYAQAWITGWQQLRQPGDLVAVDAPTCVKPGHTGTASRCTQCVAEAKGGLAEGGGR